MYRSFTENLPDQIDQTNQLVCNNIDFIKESADLYNKVTDKGRTIVSGLGDRYYSRGVDEFFMERRVPIPPELFQEMDHMRSHLTMGLFPEIKRAYVTIDCDVYLWSYEADADLAVFDGVPNTILKLHLAKPRHGIFQPHVTYLLVVGTVTDVSLFGVTNGASGDGISLIPEPLFKVDLEGQTLRTIVSTGNGRIFFTTKDILYEFDYQEKGWLGGRSCKKVNKSTTLFDSITAYIKPVVDEVEQVVIDSSRNILFALTRKSTVQVFDLGASGNECTKIVSMPISHIMHDATNATGGQHEASFFSNIITLSVVPSSQSAVINIIAVTTKGVRLYFSCYPPSHPQDAYLNGTTSTSSGQDCPRPVCLRLIHVRFSPGICPTSIYRDSPQGVYSSHNTSALSIMTTTGRDSVFALSNLFYPHSFIETIKELRVEGHVWALWTEQQNKVTLSCTATCPLTGHPFHTQHYMSSQQVLLFTNTALYIFSHQSPLDALRAALSEKGGAEGPEAIRISQTLGAQNCLVLAIALLTSDAASDVALKQKAVRLLFGLKDESEMVEGERMTVSPGDSSLAEWGHRMRSPLHASTPRGEMFNPNTPMPFSPSSPVDSPLFSRMEGPMQWKPSRRHDALYSFFSRLVYPLWHSPLVHVSSNGKIVPAVPAHQLEWLGRELNKMGAAMDEYGLVPRLTPAGDVTTVQGKMNAEAVMRERQSLTALRCFISQCAETLFLWATAIEHGLSEVTSSLTREQKEEIVTRRLSEMTCQPSLNAILIKALIEFFLGDDAGTSELSARLRSVCPTLYSKEDALVTSALETLERVSIGPCASSSRMIQHAVSLLKQSVSKLVLPQVAEKLVKLRAYDSVVDLCILRGAKDDPKKLALMAYRNGGRVDGDREAADAVTKRNGTYSVITKMLDDLQTPSTSMAPNERNVGMDMVTQCVLSSDDELAHVVVLRWLMGRGKKDEILTCKSPYMEEWLNNEIGRGGGTRYLDIMWRHYEKSGMKDKAAHLLNKLTDADIGELKLTDRLSYLSHAILCAQSMNDANSRELINELRDKLEVGHIQMAVKEALEARSPECAAKAKELNGRLLSLQELCVSYAIPYKLSKLQLEMFRCANYYNEEKIHLLWAEIMDGEFIRCSDEGGSVVLGTMADLAARFAPSNYFPTEFIVMHSLQRCLEYSVDPSFFISFSSKIGLSLVQFLEVLALHYRTGDPFWRANGRDYMINVAVSVVEDFLNSSDKYSNEQKIGIGCKCEAALSTFAVDSRSLTCSSSGRIHSRLTTVQRRLANFN